MAILKFYLIIITLIGCNDAKRITVIGVAKNDKGGAMVISKNDKRAYFMDGLEYWDDSILENEVKVTGKLVVEQNPPQKDDEDIRQDIEGEKRTLLKPKWKLIQ